MNADAKQIGSIHVNHMDNTTALSYFGQIAAIINVQDELKTAMGDVWPRYCAAYEGMDEAYAQVRKWSQTAELRNLDAERGGALSGFLGMLKMMVKSPIAGKQAAARTVQFVRDKYTVSAVDEYMKKTTAIQQMIEEMEEDEQVAQAVSASGLDEWMADLKAKNLAFLSKMNERTAEQAGQPKGLLRERRQACEAAYRKVVRVLNAMAICQTPAAIDFEPVIDRINAEVEHYRLILSRKGSSADEPGAASEAATEPTTAPTTAPMTEIVKL